MKTIPVLDDDPSIAESWKRMVHLAGYRVIIASNGSEGIAVASVEVNAHYGRRRILSSAQAGNTSLRI
jgi:DNA-binding response OmpR family regulator